MRKRGANEGSIYHMKDGRWRAAVSVGWRNGKRVRKTFTGKTRRDVSERMTALLRSQQLGLPVAPEKQTVGQFLARWLTECSKPKVRPLTYGSYSWIVNNHLVPCLGGIRLDRLAPERVQAFLNDRLAANYKPRTVQHILATLRVALRQATKWELVPRNVASLVSSPSVKRLEVQPFTPEETQAFLAAIRGDRLEGLYTLSVAVGLRQAESRGLLWECIDFNKRSLQVRHALQRLKGKGLVLAEPKTARSRRTLTIPQFAQDGLLAHRARQEREKAVAGNRWKETGFVFTTTIGTPLDGPTVSRQFRRLLEKAGFRPMRFHDLRHVCASLLLSQGTHPRLVMEMLGHSTISVTMNTYSHVIPPLRNEVADQMDAALAPVATRVATLQPLSRRETAPN